MEQMEEQMSEMLAEVQGDEEEGFSPGGAAPFPFLQNLFGGQPPKGESAPAEDADKSKGKKKEGKTPVFHAKDIGLPHRVDYWE
jgi:hypothetical protein